MLVFGGRYYGWPKDGEPASVTQRERNHVFDTLSAQHAKYQFTLLIHGGATGADTLAGDWAHIAQVPIMVFTADWRAYGLAAGPKRNQKALDEGRPELAIEFPGNDGTADMHRRCVACGVRGLRFQLQ